jgi:hypothetical protein
MANVSGAVQIETGIKHGLSIPFQSVAVEQSIDVGTLLNTDIGSKEYFDLHDAARAASSDAGLSRRPECATGLSPDYFRFWHIASVIGAFENQLPFLVRPWVTNLSTRSNGRQAN